VAARPTSARNGQHCSLVGAHPGGGSLGGEVDGIRCSRRRRSTGLRSATRGITLVMGFGSRSASVTPLPGKRCAIRPGGRVCSGRGRELAGDRERIRIDLRLVMNKMVPIRSYAIAEGGGGGARGVGGGPGGGMVERCRHRNRRPCKNRQPRHEREAGATRDSRKQRRGGVSDAGEYVGSGSGAHAACPLVGKSGFDLNSKPRASGAPLRGNSEKISTGPVGLWRRWIAVMGESLSTANP